MNITQAILHEVEVGKARVITYVVPLAIALFIVVLYYDYSLYHGLNDAQSMDNAQVARQIAQGHGFTTKFLRPYAVTQLHDYLTPKTGKLFPNDQFPDGTPKIIPDTYNAPGYPYLLAGWFKLLHPKFDQSNDEIANQHMYAGDRWIPVLNQIFMILTAILVFAMGRILFDNRVAWVSFLAFVCSNLIWQYSITALSTNVLMFLVTAMLLALLKIFCVAEAHFENDEPFWSVWLWTIALAVFLIAASLTRLHLLVLLLPVVAFLAMMPRTNFLLLPLVILLVVGAVIPWFWHVYQVCGSPFGSNIPELLRGEGSFPDNQIYCLPHIPSYEQIYKDLVKKEFSGFRWHFEHGWDLLGSNPMVLLFAASLLHRFKRPRANIFRWFAVGAAFCLIAANNLGDPTPDALGAWNTVIVLLPGMIVVGTAFFFILLDRLDLQLWLINNTIIITILALGAVPLILTVTTTETKYFNYPPYFPSIISQISQMAHPDEWVTTDMPWATAWYGDRASLWLPDKISDFEDYHDNYCPTGILFISSVSIEAPMSHMVSGEYADWFAVFAGSNIPPNFPFNSHANFEQFHIDYFIWSDTIRWK